MIILWQHFRVTGELTSLTTGTSIAYFPSPTSSSSLACCHHHQRRYDDSILTDWLCSVLGKQKVEGWTPSKGAGHMMWGVWWDWGVMPYKRARSQPQGLHLPLSHSDWVRPASVIILPVKLIHIGRLVIIRLKCHNFKAQPNCRAMKVKWKESF